VIVSSQLHTPLSVKPLQADSLGAMAAIKRETNIVDPLSRIAEPNPRLDIDSVRLNSRERILDFPHQLKATKTVEEIFMSKIRSQMIKIDLPHTPLVLLRSTLLLCHSALQESKHWRG
jgi:hypothetical protein